MICLVIAAPSASILFVISTCADAISARDVPGGTRRHC
jgi:hypothetical protein